MRIPQWFWEAPCSFGPVADNLLAALPLQAIQQDLPRPIDFNGELITVGEELNQFEPIREPLPVLAHVDTAVILVF